jgi:2-C-methyl-D-erythritol 4-phosphate cytidylyltransferase
MATETNCALLLAAGRGARMLGRVEDKILAPLGGKSVFAYSVHAFATCDSIALIGVVYRDEAQREKLAATLDPALNAKLIWTPGGAERQESVLKGLLALPESSSHTLIHDCARPLIPPERIEQLIDATREDGAASLAHPVTDTVKRIPAAGELKQTQLEDLQRERLWAMETPQAFRHAEILKAYRHVQAEKLRVTDDCAAAASIGIKTTLIHNPSPNPKITTAADLEYVSWLLSRASH